jgi:hypothetical protein
VACVAYRDVRDGEVACLVVSGSGVVDAGRGFSLEMLMVAGPVWRVLAGSPGFLTR